MSCFTLSDVADEVCEKASILIRGSGNLIPYTAVAEGARVLTLHRYSSSSHTYLYRCYTVPHHRTGNVGTLNSDPVHSLVSGYFNQDITL